MKVLVSIFDSQIQTFGFCWLFWLLYNSVTKHIVGKDVCVCVSVGGGGGDDCRTLTLRSLAERAIAWISPEMCDLALCMIIVIHTYLNSGWCSVLNSVRCQDLEFGCIHNIFPFAVYLLVVIGDYQQLLCTFADNKKCLEFFIQFLLLQSLHDNQLICIWLWHDEIIIYPCEFSPSNMDTNHGDWAHRDVGYRTGKNRAHSGSVIRISPLSLWKRFRVGHQTWLSAYLLVVNWSLDGELFLTVLLGR